MSDPARLVSELKPLLDGPLGPDREGRIWSYCPAHGDGQKHGKSNRGISGRSLSLSPTYGLTCFAGCRFEDILNALYARGGKQNPRTSAGDGQGDEVAQKRAQRSQGGQLGPEWQLCEEYEYRDADGALLAVKGRFQKTDPEAEKGYEKTFRWRLPEGEYRNGIKSRFPRGVVEMPLWGIEELSRCDSTESSHGLRVWFAEGERATQAIRARNELAVCGAWGASQRDFGSALEGLRGWEVIIWPDNDVPGREYMSAVRNALRGIAARVVTVQAPVPPKGDAVEYFAKGGTIEGLLANVVTKPTVDVLAHDHYIVRVPTDEGPVAFDFDEMARASGSLDCELTVTHLSPAAEQEPYTQRINLLSSSAREGLQRELARQFGKSINWTTVLSAAYSRARGAFLETDRAVPVGDLPEHDGQSWLVETLLPEGQPTIMFGDGSSGKTTMCYSIGLAVALGSSWNGLRVGRHGGVLIVDYETDGAQARFVLRRLLAGLGLDPVTLPYMPIHYWPAFGVPLADQADALARFVAKNEIALAIIDSGADACGGEPERAASALGYFNALSKLRTTTLTICHVNRSDADSSSRRPFGSGFWHNRARRTWYVKREQEDDMDEIDVALLCRKANTGKRPSPLAYRVEFFGEDGPIRIRPQDFRSVTAFESEHSAADRVEQCLIHAGGPMTVKEIVDETGLAFESVRTALSRGRGSRFVQLGGGKGRGHSASWGVLSA